MDKNEANKSILIKFRIDDDRAKKFCYRVLMNSIYIFICCNGSYSS